MKFFHPGTADEQEALESWQREREQREVSHKQALSNGKIFKIVYGGDTPDDVVAAQVGQVNWVAQERVLAIFGPDETLNPDGQYLIATPHKTLEVDRSHILSIEPFEE
ncbi:MAG: hypothetical protein MK210_11840 [Dehalococcoidia bacterium]|jgi:hypothetical protein|nr:hypothetical protein [Dehalococcoidia bacterium]